MAETNRTFKTAFKFCPECGGEFYFNEAIGQEYCGGCAKPSFKVFLKYYSFYNSTRREHFKEYYHHMA